MAKIKQKKSVKIQKAILLCAILFGATKMHAQVYASSQTNGANGTCVGCGVNNPQNAVDGNTSTYATAKLTVSVSGANLYQNLNFAISGSVGEYIGLAVEDSTLAPLDSASLSGVLLTTYSNNVSNNDAKTSSQFSITPLNGSSSIYLIQFQATVPFDAVQLQINAGITGTTNNLRVYYADHSATPLPITLLNFNAAMVNNYVKLNWATATETNNDYFTIERSTDSQNFYPIAKIKGAGNSTDTKEYVFIDSEPIEGVSYYRLKQTDYNGKFEYFKITDVNFKVNHADVGIYPNPAKAGVSEINITMAADASLSIINSTGKIVYSKNISYQSNESNYIVRLPLQLNPDIYSVIVNSLGETITRRLLVIN